MLDVRVDSAVRDEAEKVYVPAPLRARDETRRRARRSRAASRRARRGSRAAGPGRERAPSRSSGGRPPSSPSGRRGGRPPRRRRDGRVREALPQLVEDRRPRELRSRFRARRARSPKPSRMTSATSGRGSQIAANDSTSSDHRRPARRPRTARQQLVSVLRLHRSAVEHRNGEHALDRACAPPPPARASPSGQSDRPDRLVGDSEPLEMLLVDAVLIASPGA